MQTLKTSEAAAILNVTPNTIRAWERRFGFPRPERSPGRHRVYAYAEVSALQAGVGALDASSRRIVLRSGDTMTYDTLVLAPGARTLPAFDDALTFTGPASGPAMRALLDELDQGRVRRIALVAPTVVDWTLPLYELALLTARHAADRGLQPDIVLVTPEPPARALRGASERRCRGAARTTGRSASARRVGTQCLRFPPRHAPSRDLAGRNPGRRIGARLLTFRARAADQAHAASTPDTAWPGTRTPARLISKHLLEAPISMSPEKFTTPVDTGRDAG